MEQPSMELMKDMTDVVDKILKLQKQIDQPDRKGMIKALHDAKFSAPVEIMAVEFQQGDTTLISWDDFTNQDLSENYLSISRD